MTERRRRRLEQDGVAVSDTGELRLDSRKRTLAVISPRTVSATVAGGGLSAGPLAVAGAAGPQTLSVSSLDGRPVAASRKLLVFHLTDTLNSRMKFRGDGFRRLEHWGGTPLLLRRDPVKVTLKLDGSRPAEVEALKLDGEPYGPVSSRFSGGILEFTADPGLYRGGVMAYLITRP